MQLDKSRSKTYFFAVTALLITLGISIAGLIWLHFHHAGGSEGRFQVGTNEQIAVLQAKLVTQQKELWELRTKLHNLERLLTEKKH